jgi:multidrug efflux pump
LWIAVGTLNIYSKIGLVKGNDIIEAVEEAAVLRLRPVLMTTGAMVLGAVPFAVVHGAGAESRQQIGWLIVGGMLLGTLLTLFVVPTAYTLLARRHKTFEQRLEEERAALAPQASGAE